MKPLGIPFVFQTCFYFLAQVKRRRASDCLAIHGRRVVLVLNLYLTGHLLSNKNRAMHFERTATLAHLTTDSGFVGSPQQNVQIIIMGTATKMSHTTA